MTLRRSAVMPKKILAQVWTWLEENSVNDEKIELLSRSCPLGRILAVGLKNRNQPRFIVSQRLEDVGRQVASSLEQFLYVLEIIFSIAPFLGLLGTVLGMVEIFQVVNEATDANARELAGGISTALISTVSGLLIAIPTLIFHRYFTATVARLILEMEYEADRLLNAIS